MNCFQALVLLVVSALPNEGRWTGPWRDWPAVLLSAAAPSVHSSNKNTKAALNIKYLG